MTLNLWLHICDLYISTVEEKVQGNLLLEWSEHHHQSCTPTGAVYLIWDGQKKEIYYFVEI